MSEEKNKKIHTRVNPRSPQPPSSYFTGDMNAKINKLDGELLKTQNMISTNEYSNSNQYRKLVKYRIQTYKKIIQICIGCDYDTLAKTYTNQMNNFIENPTLVQ
jgi:hypothetical protein